MPSPFWTMQDVMEYLQVRSRTTMFKLLKDGFPHARVGKKLIFSKANVDAWIEARVVNPLPKKKPY